MIKTTLNRCFLYLQN